MQAAGPPHGGWAGAPAGWVTGERSAAGSATAAPSTQHVRGQPPPHAPPPAHAPASPELQSPHFNAHSLVDTVLDGRYRITRYLNNVTGAYGFPYQGTELATGQPVFIKVLKATPGSNAYSVSRELEAVDRMLGMQLTHEHLVRLRAVLYAATARRADMPTEVVLSNVPAVVSDFYSSGDLFDALFKPHSGGRLARPRAMPEPIALHYTWQLVQAVSCLHAQHHFHRDLKPENVMFDESYNVKVTDFGASVCVPMMDVLEQPRAMTGIHSDPNDQRMWRVGTEAYAPPEIFFPGVNGYDATKYDVWSLGIILFLMLCIDALDIIQIPEMSTGLRRTTLRMPFMSYPIVIYPLRGNVTGACGNLTNQLDDPAPSFTGLLEQEAPKNERFWRHFETASQRLSPDAKDLLNRMLVKNPEQRIDLEDVKRHPWMRQVATMRPTAEAIRHEMAHRAPPAREIAGDQRIICLLPNQEQWMSLGELRRSLRGGAVVPFPKDSDLAASVISCGAAGRSDYRAAWVFAALSHFLNSQGVVTQHFCKRTLRLSCCTLQADTRALVEQFVAQVLVVREEVLIVLQPGPEATEFPLWNDRMRVFVANQARMLPPADTSDEVFGDAGGAHGHHGRPLAAAPAGAPEHSRSVRQRVETPSGWAAPRVPAAGGDAMEVAQAAPPWSGAPAPHGAGAYSVDPSASGFSGAISSGATGTSGGTHMHTRTPSVIPGEGAQGLDWSWPPIDPDERAMSEIAFDRHMGVPRGGCLWMGKFLDFLEVVDGIPKMEAETVWHLVMPTGTRTMYKEQFVRARYILKGLSEGRALPPRFPEHVFAERAPLPVVATTFGTKANPIRYDYFAYLIRPILEAEYRRRRVVYRKISPVAVLCAADRSPFAPRAGSTVVERFVLTNLSSCADSWMIKESNFMDNYQELPMGPACIPDDSILQPSTADGEALRELVCAALRGLGGGRPASSGTTSGLGSSGAPGQGWAAADWAAVRAKLAAERTKAGPGLVWRLALPKNHVVAVRLTEEVLRSSFANLGVALADNTTYYREETYAPGYCDFRVGDYAISDVAPAASCTFFDRAGTHDRAWVWKPLNKVMRGQTLITRTIPAATFRATYVQEEIRQAPV